MVTKLLIPFGLFLLVKANTASPSLPPNISLPSTSSGEQLVKDGCLKHDYQIQDALTSTKPPFDNYFNISRAIYPSEELSSKLINIWVHFTNSSANLTQVNLRKFIWSRSCLYVSDRYLSLRAMSLYSLGSIWPDRRQEVLHITIPIFCNPKATVQKLIDFLSTLEDIAVSPTQLNPSLNHVECVVEEKLSRFEPEGVKKAFPRICWAFWCFSMIGGYFMTIVCTQLFKQDDKSSEKDVVVKATSVLLFFVCIGGISSAITAICYSMEEYKMVYPFVYLFTIGIAFVLGYFMPNWKCKTAYVYPGSFVVIHSILWMMVGMITEPFWAIPVVTSCALVIFLFYLVACFSLSSDRNWDTRDIFNFVLLVVLIMSTISVQFSLFVVGSHFFNDGLVSSVIPAVLLVILSVWCKIFQNKIYDDPKSSSSLQQTSPTSRRDESLRRHSANSDNTPLQETRDQG